MSWLIIAAAAAGGTTTVHGWTTDGWFLVETVDYDIVRVEETDDHDFVTFHHLRATAPDGRPGRMLRLEGDPIDRAPFDRFVAEHPLAGTRSVRKGPQGTQLEVRAEGGTWSGQGFTATGSMDLDGDDPLMTLGLSAAGEGWWPVHTLPLKATAFGAFTYTTTAWFHPSEPWVAIVVDRRELTTMRGPVAAEAQVVFARTRPLVAVLAADRLADRQAKAAEKLATLGTVTTGEAKKDRQATTVYYAAGFEAEGEAVAQALGATAEPMTWEGPQHVVVALGAP